MPPLSEKAKGKQRAVDPPANTPPPPPPRRQLQVRFTEGVPDLVLALGEADTVKDLKAKIRDARPQLQRRRLRLIHSGRLLTDDTALFSLLSNVEQNQRRAARHRPQGSMSSSYDQVIEADEEAESPPAGPSMAWLHCSVGRELAEGEEEEEREPQTAQIRPLRGFDRLTAAGFSPADIANFRRQFHMRTSEDYLSMGDFASQEEYEEYARNLEEQWIDSLDNAGTAAISQSDPQASSILEGIVIGFFFPLLPFFFFRDQKLPVFWENNTSFESQGSVIFSRRMQMGLVAGFLVNVLFGLWRYLWSSL